MNMENLVQQVISRFFASDDAPASVSKQRHNQQTVRETFASLATLNQSGMLILLRRAFSAAWNVTVLAVCITVLFGYAGTQSAWVVCLSVVLLPFLVARLFRTTSVMYLVYKDYAAIRMLLAVNRARCSDEETQWLCSLGMDILSAYEEKFRLSTKK